MQAGEGVRIAVEERRSSAPYDPIERRDALLTV